MLDFERAPARCCSRTRRRTAGPAAGVPSSSAPTAHRASRPAKWVELTSGCADSRRRRRTKRHFHRQMSSSSPRPRETAGAVRARLGRARRSRRRWPSTVGRRESTPIELVSVSGRHDRRTPALPGRLTCASPGVYVHCRPLTIVRRDDVGGRPKHAPAVSVRHSPSAPLRSGPGEESAFFSAPEASPSSATGVITLGTGEPDIPTPRHIVEAAKSALDERLHDLHDSGRACRELRAAIAEKLRRDNGLSYYPASEIIVTTGAQEAIAVVMQTLLDPGDEVLIAAPYYSGLRDEHRPRGWRARVRSRRLRVRRLPDRPAPSRDADHGAHEVACDRHPEQPDRGGAHARDARGPRRGGRAQRPRRALRRALREGRLRRFRARQLRLARRDAQRTIVVNGFSKSYSMTGFRVGYMAGPARLHPVPRSSRGTALSIASPMPFQYAALAALTGPQEHLEPMMAEYTRRRTRWRRSSTSSASPTACRAAPSTSGPTCRAPACRRSSCAAGASTITASCSSRARCTGPRERGTRISFLAPPDQLEEALARFAALYRECQAEREHGR